MTTLPCDHILQVTFQAAYNKKLTNQNRREKESTTDVSPAELLSVESLDVILTSYNKTLHLEYWTNKRHKEKHDKKTKDHIFKFYDQVFVKDYILEVVISLNLGLYNPGFVNYFLLVPLFLCYCYFFYI